MAMKSTLLNHASIMPQIRQYQTFLASIALRQGMVCHTFSSVKKTRGSEIILTKIVNYQLRGFQLILLQDYCLGSYPVPMPGICLISPPGSGPAPCGGDMPGGIPIGIPSGIPGGRIIMTGSSVIRDLAPVP